MSVISTYQIDKQPFNNDEMGITFIPTSVVVVTPFSVVVAVSGQHIRFYDCPNHSRVKCC